jgi:phosphoribosyl 1,2-cyclic phosphodiesterase
MAGPSGISSSMRRRICAPRALAHNVNRVDAILFTRSHADHIMGLDGVALQASGRSCFADGAAGPC